MGTAPDVQIHLDNRTVGASKAFWAYIVQHVLNNVVCPDVSHLGGPRPHPLCNECEGESSPINHFYKVFQESSQRLAMNREIKNSNKGFKINKYCSTEDKYDQAKRQHLCEPFSMAILYKLPRFLLCSVRHGKRILWWVTNSSSLPESLIDLSQGSM
jgi:hypothetical protein